MLVAGLIYRALIPFRYEQTNYGPESSQGQRIRWNPASSSDACGNSAKQ